MPITCIDFLDQAKALSASEKEPDDRTSVSRSYYSAFHKAIEASVYCPENAHFVINAGMHTKLINRFEIFDKTHPLKQSGKSIAYALKQMKEYRRVADYELLETFPHNLALVQIHMAETVIGRIDTFIAASQANVA